MNYSRLPFCSDCPVAVNGHAGDKTGPVQYAADHIDIMNEAIAGLHLIIDSAAETPSQAELAATQAGVDEAATETSQAISEHLDRLAEADPTAENVSVLLDLGACAAKIAGGTCQRLTPGSG